VRDLASALGIHEVQMRMTLIRLASQGELYQIVKDLFYHPVHVQAMAQLVRDIAQSVSNHNPRQGVSAAQFRDATGLGRKRAIQILEFFDKIGFCQRVGEVHLIRAGTTLFSNPKI
jgi:selenocysteine-specific elongation factor